MSLKFKSWVMDGYQLADESYHSFKDKLYDKVKLSEAELEDYEHELWEHIKEQKFREYVLKYNTALIVGEEDEQSMGRFNLGRKARRNISWLGSKS